MGGGGAHFVGWLGVWSGGWKKINLEERPLVLGDAILYRGPAE